MKVKTKCINHSKYVRIQLIIELLGDFRFIENSMEGRYLYNGEIEINAFIAEYSINIFNMKRKPSNEPLKLSELLVTNNNEDLTKIILFLLQ